MDFDKLNKSNLISRDFSWLNFNYRVFDQVKNEKRNILDRLKFLSIVSSNFDEFFEVRVGSCLLYTSPSPRDKRQSRMPSSA